MFTFHYPPHLYIPATSFWSTHVLQWEIANNFNTVQWCTTYHNEFNIMWLHELQALVNNVMNWLVEDMLASQEGICSMDFFTNSNDFLYKGGRKISSWGASVSIHLHTQIQERREEEGRRRGRGQEKRRGENRISSPLLFLRLAGYRLMEY